MAEGAVPWGIAWAVEFCKASRHKEEEKEEEGNREYWNSCHKDCGTIEVLLTQACHASCSMADPSYIRYNRLHV